MAGNFLDDVDLVEYMRLLAELGYESLSARSRRCQKPLSAGDSSALPEAPPSSGRGDGQGGDVTSPSHPHPPLQIPSEGGEGGVGSANVDALGALARDVTRAGVCYMRLWATAGHSCVEGCTGRMWPVTHAMDKSKVLSEDGEDEVDCPRAEVEDKRRAAIGLWRRALANMASRLGFDIQMGHPQPDDGVSRHSDPEETPAHSSRDGDKCKDHHHKETPAGWWPSSKPWSSKGPLVVDARRDYVPPPEEGGPLPLPSAKEKGGRALGSKKEPPPGVAKVLLGGLIQDVPAGFLPSKPFFRYGSNTSSGSSNPPPQPPSDTPSHKASACEVSSTASSTSSANSESDCSTWRKMARTAVDAPQALLSLSKRVSERLTRRTMSVGVLERARGGVVAGGGNAEGTANDSPPGGAVRPHPHPRTRGCPFEAALDNEQDLITKHKRYIFNHASSRKASAEQVPRTYHPWSVLLQRALSEFKVPNLLETVAATPRVAVAAATAIGETLTLPEMSETFPARSASQASSCFPHRNDSTASLPPLLRAAQSALPGLVSYDDALRPSGVAASTSYGDNHLRSHHRATHPHNHPHHPPPPPLLPNFIRGIGHGLGVDNLLPAALTTRMLYMSTDHFNPRDATVANLLLGAHKIQSADGMSPASPPRAPRAPSHRRPTVAVGTTTATAAGEAAAAAAAGVGEPPSALSPAPADGSSFPPHSPRPHQRPMSCRLHHQRSASTPRPPTSPPPPPPPLLQPDADRQRRS